MKIIPVDSIGQIREDLRGYVEAFADRVTYRDNLVRNYNRYKAYLNVTDDLLVIDDDMECIGYWQQPWQEEDNDMDIYIVHEEEARVLRRMGLIR